EVIVDLASPPLPRVLTDNAIARGDPLPLPIGVVFRSIDYVSEVGTVRRAANEPARREVVLEVRLETRNPHDPRSRCGSLEVPRNAGRNPAGALSVRQIEWRRDEVAGARNELAEFLPRWRIVLVHRITIRESSL